MTTGIIITIVSLAITYIGALVSIYVNLRVNMKELDVKIVSIQSELTEFKKSYECEMKGMIADHKQDVKDISIKLDLMMERIYELKNKK